MASRWGSPPRARTATTPPLLAPTLNAAISQLGGIVPDERTCHLDAGYDGQPSRQALSELGFDGQIARKGVPPPVQAGQRWPVERTHSWMNQPDASRPESLARRAG